MEHSDYVESNRKILLDSIKKLGVKRINFDEKEIESISKSKSFHFTDYLKKLVVLNRVIDVDPEFTIETGIKADYDKLLAERKAIETNKIDKLESKRYKDIKVKTDYGFSFFALSSYFTPKKLNEVYKSKKAEPIVYRLDNEIERRMKKSCYFKTDKPRAEANAIVNIFKGEFPKNNIEQISKASLHLDNNGFTPTKAAALTMHKLCSSGVLSSLVNKVTDRCDTFVSKFSKVLNFKNDNKIKNIAKHGLAIAATAAVVALVGHEASDLLINLPLNFLPVEHLSASIDLPSMDVTSVPSGLEHATSHLATFTSNFFNSSPDLVSNVPVDHVINNMPTDHLSDVNSLLQSKLEIASKPDIIHVTNNMSLDSIAEHVLGHNASMEDKQRMISAISELNDLDNPNLIKVGQELELPNATFLQNYQAPSFNVDLSASKQDIIEQMKNVTINYGETKSQLIEKLMNGAKEMHLSGNKLNNLSSQLNNVIPTDLKAYDDTITGRIKDVIEHTVNFKNSIKLKL